MTKNKAGVKEDPRSLRSRRDLANALESLLTKKDFSGITVKQICDEALVSRLTFYNHFRNKRDLLCDCFLRWTAGIGSATLSTIGGKSNAIEARRTIIKSLVHLFYSKEQLLKNLVANDHSRVIYWLLTKACQEIIAKVHGLFASDLYSGIPAMLRESYYAGAFVNVLYAGITGKELVSENQMCDFLYRLTFPGRLLTI